MTKSIYLCGSMSNLKDMGFGWRKKISKWLDKHGELVYNPCIEEKVEHEKYKTKEKDKKNWEKLPHGLQEHIIRKDLDQIKNHTKYIICYFTRYSTGTVSELTFAYYHKIPVYFVTKLDLVGWPSTVARTKGNFVFNNFNQLKDFLSTIEDYT